MGALEVLSQHQLLTSWIGLAVCSEKDCAWQMRFERKDLGVALGDVPVCVGESHAAHQLELLKAEGFSQAGSAKADIALRRIADEVQLMEWGGVVTGECGPVWIEPARPFPRGGRMIKAILTEVLG